MGDSLFCPDVPDYLVPELKGTRQDPTYQSIDFQILKCDETSPLRDDSYPACASNLEILKYIENLSIKTIATHFDTDFNNYGVDPVMTVQSDYNEIKIHDHQRVDLLTLKLYDV